MANETKAAQTAMSPVKKITVIIALGIAAVTASYTCGATHPFKIDVVETAPTPAGTASCSMSPCPMDDTATQSHGIINVAIDAAVDAAAD